MQSTVVERSGPSQTLRVDVRREAPPSALRVHLREGPTGEVQARLDEALSCRTVARELTARERVTVNELSTLDTAVMWTSYGLAALVGGSVATGISRGGEPRRGALLFGVFGLPFLVVGGVESVRALDTSTPLPPEQRDVERGVGPCTPELERVHLVEAPTGAALDAPSLTASWQTTAVPTRYVDAPPSGTSAAVALEGDRLVARLTPSSASTMTVASTRSPPPDLASAPAAAPQPTPAAAPQPTPAAAPQPTLAAAPQPPPAAAPARESPCSGVVQRGKEGPLPQAFFEQPTAVYEVQPGDWLSKLSLKLFGTVIDYHQLQLLNGSVVADPDRIEVGQTLALPRTPRKLSAWKAEVPEVCRVP